MKKIFTTLFVAALAVSGFAQGVEFQRGGKTVPNGSAISVGYEEVIPGILYKWDSGLSILSDKTQKVNVTIASDDNTFQLCEESGACWAGHATVEYSVTANTPLALDAHRQLQSMTGVTPCSGTITVASIDNPSETSTITINYVDQTAAGVESVAADANAAIRFDGHNALVYNVASPVTVHVYSILGNKVADYAVSGQGTIALDNLGKGLYIYKAGNLTGKMLLK